MKKYQVMSCILFLFVLLLAGCSKKEEKELSLDVNALADDLHSSISYEDTLEEMDSSLFSYLYEEIEEADIAEKKIYISTGSTAEEIAVFKAVDKDAAKRIEDGVKARIEMQTESFTDYVPDEVKRLEDAIVKKEGSYVVLSVSGEVDTAKEIIDKYFK